VNAIHCHPFSLKESCFPETLVTLTLLIDLDNTLLSNDMDVFLPAYLQALSKHLAPYADPPAMVAALMNATRRMVENRRPDCTLIEVFNAAFYPVLGLDVEDMREPIQAFYRDVFPSLKALTRPRPGAVQIVEQALQRGYQVVIATNPLFPRTAILQRLEWAGLPLEKFPFSLISTVEGFHFSKPHPAYIAECLGQIGWPEGTAVIVGDDPERDIRPAQASGLPAYWIDSGRDWPLENSLPPTTKGSLDGFLPWLDAQPADALQPDFSSPLAILAILQSTPAVLDSLLRFLPESGWAKSAKPGEWSQTEIVCHLRDVEEEVNLARLKKVLQEKNAFLPGMDTDTWAGERQYFCQDGPDALRRFTLTRLKLLDLIENLAPEDWERSARHAILGNTRLIELINIIASHDRLHIQQIMAGL
jgi:FMN phosphatase YigB (HAD superfamily)